MRKPDYNKMREMLAESEADNIDFKDLAYVFLFGTKGWKDWEDEDILDEFVKLWGTKDIPKKEVKNV